MAGARKVTSDSKVYRNTFYGILNAHGEFWTPLAFGSEADARDALGRFIKFSPEKFGAMRRTHKIVPVRIRLEALEQPTPEPATSSA